MRPIFMNFSKAISLVLLTAALIGCSALSPKGKPEDSAWIMSQAQQYKTPSGLLGPSGDKRVPLRAGQWAASLTRSKTDPHDISLHIVKVVAVSGNTVTLETEMYSSMSPGERTVMQQTVRGMDMSGKLVYDGDDASSELRNIEVLKISMLLPDGTIQEVPNMGMNLGQMSTDIFKSHVAVGEVRKERCESQYLKAAQCFLIPYEVKVLWLSEKGTTYAHSSIPVLGYIKSDSTGHLAEVISYGQSGARVLIR